MFLKDVVKISKMAVLKPEKQETSKYFVHCHLHLFLKDVVKISKMAVLKPTMYIEEERIVHKGPNCLVLSNGDSLTSALSLTESRRGVS